MAKRKQVTAVADRELCEVLKPFEADRSLETGDVVDAAGWRMLRQLIEQKYLRRMSKAEVERYDNGGKRPMKKKTAKAKTARKPRNVAQATNTE